MRPAQGLGLARGSRLTPSPASNSYSSLTRINLSVRQAGTPVGTLGWEKSDRAWFWRWHITAGDDWLRSQLDPVATAALRQREYGHILPAEDTVPEELLPMFAEFAAAVKGVWRLNYGLELMVREERTRLHLGRGRNNGRGSGRAPVIGAHLRLGDKEPESREQIGQVGIKNTYGNLSVYWEGKSKTVGTRSRVSESQLGLPSPRRGDRGRQPAGGNFVEGDQVLRSADALGHDRRIDSAQ